MKTFHPTPKDIERMWHLIDAQGQVLGRLASRIATILRGKQKPTFAPYVDGGDFVVVINAEKVVLTGKKRKAKIYYRHSGYPGGLKSTTPERILKEHPERLLRQAVKGMLPKNKLGDALLSKLKIYAGPSHPHQAQKPERLVIAS